MISLDSPFVPQVMTADEVATVLRLRPSTVRDLARRGEIPSFRLGRHRRFAKTDISVFLETQRATGGKS